MTNGFKASIPVLIVLLVWIVVNALLFSSKGVKVVGDSARYIEYANGLSSGFYVDSHNFWYIGYSIYLLVVFHVFGSDVAGVVIGQYLFALLSIVALYRTSMLLFKSTVGSVASCLLFVAFADISLWNSYILTESLYTSFTCFSIYFLTLVYKRSASAANIMLVIVAVVFTFFIKPTGIALLAAVMAVTCYELFQRLQGRLVRGAVLVSATLILLLLVNRMLTTYTIIENYKTGEIVYGTSTYQGKYSVDGLYVTPPTDLEMPDPSLPPLMKVALFIISNPIYWTKLFVLKVYYLLAHVRPFWSTLHNLWSVLILPLSYVFFFRKVFDKKLDWQVRLFAIAYLSIHIVSVGVTSEDWDGRFLIPMLPVVFIFSGSVVGSIAEKLKIS